MIHSICCSTSTLPIPIHPGTVNGSGSYQRCYGRCHLRFAGRPNAVVFAAIKARIGHGGGRIGCALGRHLALQLKKKREFIVDFINNFIYILTIFLILIAVFSEDQFESRARMAVSS